MKKSVAVFLALVFLFVSLTGCSKKASVQENGVPQRIVALSPAAAEILFLVGAGNQVVAVSDFTDYPPEAAELPKVGGFDGKTLSMEAILSFKPDFIYMTDGMHNYMIGQLDEYGIKYYVSTADSIKEIEKEVSDIGEITGHAQKAQEIVAQMEEKLALLEATDKSIPVFYEVWNAPYMTCGSESFICDVLEVAGFKNIFDDVDEAYPIVSEESILAREPEIIFITQSAGVTVEDVKKRTGWETIPAVLNNKIIVVNDNILSRPVPRVLDEIGKIGF